MKVLKKKGRGYRSFSEKYDLSGCYAGKQGIPIGVLLLYILVQSTDFDMETLTAEAQGEIGEERNILRVDKWDGKALFACPETVATVFKDQELVIWELQGTYQNTDVAITGRTYGTIISIRIPLKSKTNMIPWMSTVESATYDYHDYDIALIDTLKHKFKMNQKMAIQSILKLQKESDIWAEFVQGIESNPFAFPKENAIAVEGLTAEHLYKNYPLSEFGAYNYLIYLRKDPKNAINDLKQGLPRK